MSGAPPRASTQAYIISYFTLASVLWITVVAYALDTAVHNPIKALSLAQRDWAFHLFAWGVPLFMTMLPSTTDSYGQAGSFCWIRTGGIGTVWRFVQFYVPLWACMAYAARVTLLTRRTLRLALHSHPNGAVQLRQQSLAMFPVILLIAWTFGTVNRIQNSIAPSSASFPLYLLQLLFGNLQGLMDAAAYAHSNLVRRGVRRAWLRWRGHGSRGRTKSLELRGNGDEAGEHAAPSVAVADGDDDDDDALSEDRIATPRVSAHHRFLGDGERDEGEKGDEDLSDVTHQIRAAYMQSLGLFDALGMHVDHAAFKRLADLSLLDREERELELTGKVVKAHKATVTQTYITLAKSFVGIGVLALPHAYLLAGMLGGTLGLVLVATVSYFCMQLLVRCGDIVQGRLIDANTVSSSESGASGEGRPRSGTAEDSAAVSFADIGVAAFGARGGKAVDISLIFSQVGFSISYLIFIGKNVEAVSAAIFTHSPGSVVYTVIVGFMLLPLVWLRSLKRLAFTALLADVAILFGLLTVYSYDVAHLADQRSVHVLRGATLPLFFGVAVFTFEGIGLVIPVRHAMQEPEKFPSVLRRTMVALGVLYVTFGMLSYLAFGDDTRDIITLNLPNNPLVAMVRLLYSTGLLFTLPIMLFPALQILENTQWYYRIPNFRSMRRRGFRSLVVAFSVFTACVVPHFGLFVNLIGSVACTLLAFIFPSLFYLRLANPGTKTRRFIIACVVFGFIGGGISFVLTIVEFIELAAGDGNPSAA